MMAAANQSPPWNFGLANSLSMSFFSAATGCPGLPGPGVERVPEGTPLLTRVRPQQTWGPGHYGTRYVRCALVRRRRARSQTSLVWGWQGGKNQLGRGQNLMGELLI